MQTRSSKAVARRHFSPPPPIKWVAVVLCLLMTAGLGVVVMTDRAQEAAAPPPASGPVPVTATQVVLREFADRIEAIGNARARESVTISAQVTEVVGQTTFSDGDTIKAGDILVALIDSEESAQLAEARADLAEAVKQHARVAELVKRGNAAASRLDRQTALRDAAQARMDAVSARLSDRLIRAPFDGVLGLRLVSPGSLLEPGDPIVTLDDIEVIKLDFPVPEIHLAALAVGQNIEAASVVYPGFVFKGVVTAIEPRVDPVTRAVGVRAEIPNSEKLLKPGMLLTVGLISRLRQAPAVPESALLHSREGHFVFRIGDAGTVRRQPVRIGARSPGKVEILDGLQPGDRVVVDGVHRVRDDQQVEIVKMTSGPGV